MCEQHNVASRNMNAHALLTSQGWRGDGNTLHPSSNAVGLSHRLLVSQKSNTLGVGKKQHGTSDMWWMNAFDKSLKGMQVGQKVEEGDGKIVEASVKVQVDRAGPLESVRTACGVGRWSSGGGLYGRFVQGKGLDGTLGKEDVVDRGDGIRKIRRCKGYARSQESKMANVGELNVKEERTKQRSILRSSKETVPITPPGSGSDDEVDFEEKETRRAKRSQKAARKGRKERTGPFITPLKSDGVEDVPTGIDESKREPRGRNGHSKALQERASAPIPPPESEGLGDSSISRAETKEDRRERKRLKRLLRQEVKAPEADVNEPKRKKRRKS